MPEISTIFMTPLVELKKNINRMRVRQINPPVDNNVIKDMIKTATLRQQFLSLTTNSSKIIAKLSIIIYTPGSLNIEEFLRIMSPNSGKN